MGHSALVGADLVAVSALAVAFDAVRFAVGAFAEELQALAVLCSVVVAAHVD